MAQFINDLPPDLAASQDAIQRRRAVAQMLLQQGLGPMQLPQQTGRLASPVSPVAGLGNLLQTYLGAKGYSGADKEQTSLANTYKARKNNAIREYLEQRGKDPGAASQMALMSDFGSLQDLGKLELELAAKNALTGKDLLNAPGMSPESRRDAAGGGGLSALKPEPKVQAVGDTLLEIPRTEGAQPRVLGEYGPQWEKNPDGTPKITQIAGADGKLEPYQRNLKSGELKKLDQAPKITATASTGFNKKIPETLAVAATKRFEALGNQVSGANDAAATVARLEELDKQGIFTNKPAGVETLLANISQRLGLKVDEQRLANSETYQSEVAKLWLAAMETVTGGARGLTEKETDELKKLQPQIQNSPAARQRIYALYKGGATRMRGQFTKAQTALKKALEADNPGALVEALGEMYTTGNPLVGGTPEPEAPNVKPAVNILLERGLPPPKALPQPQGELRQWRP